LQSIPAFVPLNQSKNSKTLSEGITLQHFGIGEQVVRQGYISNALYIIVSGQAVMTVMDGGEKHDILPLKAGEFFGEMILFSGKLSPLSVTAVNDLKVVMISAPVVNQMIERQPSFAREISQILELRRQSIQSVKQTGAASLSVNF